LPFWSKTSPRTDEVVSCAKAGVAIVVVAARLTMLAARRYLSFMTKAPDDDGNEVVQSGD
jgi:hypothetical protein